MKKNLNIIPYFIQNNSKDTIQRNNYYVIVLWIAVLLPALSKGFWTNDGSGIHFFQQIMGCGVLVGVTYYGFLKVFRNSEIAALCTALYALVVRRDGENMIVFTAISLIWYELYKLELVKNDRRKKAVTLLVLTLGFLFLASQSANYFEGIMILSLLMKMVNLCIRKNGRSLVEVAVALLPAVCVILLRTKAITDIYLIQENGAFVSDNLLQFNVLLLGGISGILVLWLCGYLHSRQGEEESFLCAMTITTVGLLLLSLRTFPWDRIQLINGYTYKGIGLLETPDVFGKTALICLVACWGALLKQSKEHAGQVYRICMICLFITITFTGIYAIEKNKIGADEIMRIQMQSGIEETAYEDNQE